MNRTFRERFFKNIEQPVCAKPLLKKTCNKQCDTCDYCDYNGSITDRDILNLIGILTREGNKDWIGGTDADSIADSVLLACSHEIEKAETQGKEMLAELWKEYFQEAVCKE
jgi:hypothetical protein